MQIVAAHSRRRALALLQWDGELYAAAALLVQGTSLLSNDASLAESLYGLRRVTVQAQPAQGKATRLASWQRLLSALILVRTPCLVSVGQSR